MTTYDRAEVEDDEGTIINLTAEVEVTTTSDMYGTGDSPKGYLTDIIKVYDTDTNKSFPVREISASTVEWVENKAIDIASRR